MNPNDFEGHGLRDDNRTNFSMVIVTEIIQFFIPYSTLRTVINEM